MTIQLPRPDAKKVRQTVSNLRQHRLAMEEATLALDKISAQLEHHSRQRYLNRLNQQESRLAVESEISQSI
jgi:hypothetical protein